MLPLLFLDVDGPLNPFQAPTGTLTADYVTHQLCPWGWATYRVRLNPEHGTALTELPYELVWATAWEQAANRLIGPRTRIPDLPAVGWRNRDDLPDGTFYKTPNLVRFAAGRPFAWVDDEIGQADRAHVAAHHPGPALLHRIDPAVGLTSADFATLAEWATALTSAA